MDEVGRLGLLLGWAVSLRAKRYLGRELPEDVDTAIARATGDILMAALGGYEAVDEAIDAPIEPMPAA